MIKMNMSRGYLKRLISIGILVNALLLIGMSTNAYGFESRLNAFKAEYPLWPVTADNGTHGCVTCHTSNSGGGVNSYRADFSANSFSFTAIENLDSDNDGVTNINEILVGFHPGWKSGDAGVNSLGVNISAFLTPQSNLGLSIAAPNSVTVGENITYQLTVTNAGPQDATSVMLSNTLPANVNFVSSNPTQGSCSDNGTVIDCSLGRVNVGATVMVTIVVTTTAVGELMNNAMVSAGQLETNAADNAASASTTVNQVVVPPPPGGTNSGIGYLPAIMAILLADDEIKLASGQPKSDSVNFNQFKFYSIDATGSVNNVLVELTGLSSDVDVYVLLGSRPTLTLFECSPFLGGTSNETCDIPIPSTPTRVFIGVHGYTAGSFTIEATLRNLD